MSPEKTLSVKSTAPRGRTSDKSYELLEFRSLPNHLRDNEFIHKHYRGEWPVHQALLSLFRIHNETGNIWTHLVGFVLFVALTVYTATKLATVVDLHHLPPFHLPPSLANISGAIPYHIPDVTQLRDSLQHIELPKLTELYDRLPHIGLPSLPTSLYEAMPHMPHFLSLQEAQEWIGSVPLPDLSAFALKLRSQEAFLLKKLQPYLAHVGFPSLDGTRARVLWTYAFLLHAHAVRAESQCPAHPGLEELSMNTEDDDGEVVCGLDDKPWPLKRLLDSIAQPSPTARWPFFLFLAGAMVCLLASSTCHLLGCQSRAISELIWRFDYAGIAVLICTSFYPIVYYLFLCMPMARNIYLTAITIIGVGAICASLMSSFQGPQYRVFRACLFFGMGFSGIIPGAHIAFLFYDDPQVMTVTMLELLMGAFYGLGALFYATHIPERWMPGKFDIVGHSHQIFHLLVIAGAFTHYKAATMVMEWRDVHPCVKI